MTYGWYMDGILPICEPWCWNMNPNIYPKNDPVMQVYKFQHHGASGVYIYNYIYRMVPPSYKLVYKPMKTSSLYLP